MGGLRLKSRLVLLPVPRVQPCARRFPEAPLPLYTQGCHAALGMETEYHCESYEYCVELKIMQTQ